MTQAALADSPSRRTIHSEQRLLRTETGEAVPYEIGTLLVPENRNRPDSRLIGVGFARLPAASADGGLANFHLCGGPGSSHLGALDPQTDAERMKLRELLRYRAVGDVVILDQRGYSRRGEMLEYATRLTDAPLDAPGRLAVETKAFVEAARAAVIAHQDKDLSGYTVLECADDVEAMRRALGYGSIALVGQSFGSQWSLAVMRRHPGTVARAMLSGLEPLDHAYDMPSHVFAALQRISWDADHDAGLRPYLPEGGLMGALANIRERLREAAVEVEVADGARLTLGLEDFQRALLRPAATWPAFVLSVFHGRYEQWAQEILDLRTRRGATEPLIKPLIDTSLGVSPARRHLLRTDPGGDVMGWWDFDAYSASEAVWPSPDVGDDFRSPVLDSTPVVFICGDWDTATPIENMFATLPYFPNGRAIVVHRGPHAARAIITEQGSPAIEAVLEFLKTGDSAAVPASVTLAPPVFDPPPFDPPASTTRMGETA